MSRPATSPRRPFTLQVATATARKLAAFNKRPGRAGLAAYEATRAAVARVLRQHTANPERLESWITHPDERVAIALLRCRRHVRRLSTEQKARLARRAIAAADRRRVLWTPLLDALDCAFRGPFRWDYGLLPLFDAVDDRLGDLSTWIADHAGVEDVAELLTFSSSLIGDQVAAVATCIDAATARNLVGDPERCRLLVANPFLSRQASEVLLEFLFQALVKRRRGRARDIHDHIPFLFELTFTSRVYLPVSRLKVLLRRMHTLEQMLDARSYEVLRDVVIETARHRLPEMNEYPQDLAVLFACPDEQVRLTVLDWLGSGLIVPQQDGAA